MRVEVARDWESRWDRQQTRYIADRELRFTVCVELVEAATAQRRDARVLDLGCGPGSLLRRITERLPGVVAAGIDRDPLLLEIARCCCPDATLIDADLTDVGAWAAQVAALAPLDAVVSSTALHWLPPEQLAALYVALAPLLRPGGLFINADHLFDPQPTIAALAAQLRRRREEDCGVTDHEDWATWWQAVATDPETAELAARRAEAGVTGGWNNGLSVQAHADLLQAAGFDEVGPVWQYGNDVVLVAVRGTDPAVTAGVDADAEVDR